MNDFFVILQNILGSFPVTCNQCSADCKMQPANNQVFGQYYLTKLNTEEKLLANNQVFGQYSRKLSYLTKLNTENKFMNNTGEFFVDKIQYSRKLSNLTKLNTEDKFLDKTEYWRVSCF